MKEFKITGKDIKERAPHKIDHVKSNINIVKLQNFVRDKKRTELHN